METINIAKDFTVTPGARFRRDGDFSGEEFREVFLEPHFEKDKEYDLLVIFDGTIGYGTSFLEEAFGGLARKFGTDRVKRRLTYISDEDPLIIEEVTGYVDNPE